ncbi:hypothetical protein V6N12_046371 [Hibiscus sabdariffa]|uniref:RRM domain-containing protein n=1 Tax=Hibiscus sabdariffa TaxID=183260 RepID=A0ABR2DIG3_9ROSI
MERQRLASFTVFVNKVSRRIHKSVLWEAFNFHGEIYDVYIAYWNKKCIHQNITFVFVLFCSKSSMLKAIEKGERIALPPRVEAGPRKTTQENSYKVKESRSYKDVLVGLAPDARISGKAKSPTNASEREVSGDDPKCDAIVQVKVDTNCVVDIPKEDMLWVKRFLDVTIQKLPIRVTTYALPTWWEDGRMFRLQMACLAHLRLAPLTGGILASEERWGSWRL